ncbi:LacI family transcriptional regulator [Monaibacterium marinum]|uniref:LacI family transcriptional regulator n=1 Tax=Pontivivens marinum TaxID=1690039 RepID=A0A2C9CUL7_9RHOB|nr:substrate-binding domain-containing protein [Monaibacterium marinum]SOH95014.1 LacI family transcriptional regulator [Monaibacterium marinum]
MAVERHHDDLRSQRLRVTISDVSDALGVTKSTVSRALNGYSDISEATRLRVRRMADKMGYRPLSHAQAIRTGRTKSLGLVIQLSDHDAQRPFLAEFLAGLSQGASQEGWTLTIAASDSQDAALETFRSMISDRKADGFILPRTLSKDPRVELLRAADVPFVLFGRADDPTGCAWFDVLGEDAMHDAVRHLAALGHRRIGFINGGMQYTYAPLRRDGFLSAMAQEGLPIDPAHMCEDAVTIGQGEVAALEILSSETPPTAIICAVDMSALGVYRAAAGQGLSIGRDLSVIAYDGTPDGSYLTPPLSTFSVDFTQAGKRLSALLIRRIMGEPVENLRETVHAQFLDRGSAGPPPQHSHD